MRGSKQSLHYEIFVTNKSFGYPATEASLSLLTTHVHAAIKDVKQKLADNLDNFKGALVNYAAEAKALLDCERHLGSEEIPVGGKRISGGADLSRDACQRLKGPELASPSSTYPYESMTITRKFKPPACIALEDGGYAIFKEYGMAPRSEIGGLVLLF